jgi:hypothetical protein
MKKFPLAVAITLGLCVALGGPSPARADVTTIDNFATTQGPLTIFGNPPIPSNPVFSGLSPAPGALGDARTITLTRTSANAGIVQADVGLSLPGAFAFFSSPATTGTALLKYDGSTSATLNPTGLGGKDLRGILTGQVASDLGGSLVFTFYTDATHFSQLTIPVNGSPSSPAFDIFVATGSIPTGPGAAGPADFANIGAVTLLVESTSGAGNIFIRGLAIVIPEPGTLALFSVCLVGLSGVGLYRRRNALTLARRGATQAGQGA